MKPYTSMAERFERWTMPEPNSGCLLWFGPICTAGYGNFYRPGGNKLRSHREAWKMKHGEIPDGLWVLHKCDTPACVNPDHLFLGTSLDNVRDMVRKGRNGKGIQPGVSNGRAKLTEEQALDVKRRVNAGETVASMARSLGVGVSTIQKIVSGRRWRHLGVAA